MSTFVVQEDGGRAEPDADGTVFTIPPADSDRSARDWLRESCDQVFAQMLTDWHRDKATWPKSLNNWALFTAWFNIQFVGAVHDLDSDTAWLESDNDE